MNYKLQLHMPNGEVIESAIVDAETLDEYQTAYDQSNYNEDLTFTFKHTKGKRIMSGTTCRQCTLDVIEVDQPIEQPQPTETSNVGKRVEFKIGWEVKEGIIKADPLDLYCILYNGTVYHRIKSDCTILEDQPKSNVGRSVRFPDIDGTSIGVVVIDSDDEYVVKYGNYHLVYEKSLCELLPE